jgi:hypothetical protein
LDKCESCSRELTAFQNLSAMARCLAQPDPPAQMWEGLERQMAAEQSAGESERAPGKSRRWARSPGVWWGIAVAATLLIAVYWLGNHRQEHREHEQMAALFGEFIEELPRSRDTAERILPAHYGGRKMDAQQAVQVVGYRPLVAGGLPEGYSVTSTHVMKMPCCTCVQCVCTRSDGSSLAIFEHDERDTGWFGSRPETDRVCNGTSCRVVDLDNSLAATWNHGSRHITLVGVRDLAELEHLVAWFDNKRRGGIPEQGVSIP